MANLYAQKVDARCNFDLRAQPAWDSKTMTAAVTLKSEAFLGSKILYWTAHTLMVWLLVWLQNYRLLFLQYVAVLPLRIL